MRAEFTGKKVLDDLLKQVDKFTKSHDAALATAATLATNVSQDTFRRNLSTRPTIRPRDGRNTTQGNFADSVQWVVDKRSGYVRFQRALMESVAAEYWLVQEIGTGDEATILDEGTVIDIPSQKGRRIPSTLVWADAENQFAPRMGAKARTDQKMGSQQLMSYKDVKNGPYRQDLEEMRIGKEIEGKHFIRQGGRVANREYRSTLLSLAQQTFSKP